MSVELLDQAFNDTVADTDHPFAGDTLMMLKDNLTQIDEIDPSASPEIQALQEKLQAQEIAIAPALAIINNGARYGQSCNCSVSASRCSRGSTDCAICNQVRSVCPRYQTILSVINSIKAEIQELTEKEAGIIEEQRLAVLEEIRIFEHEEQKRQDLIEFDNIQGNIVIGLLDKPNTTEFSDQLNQEITTNEIPQSQQKSNILPILAIGAMIL